MNDELDIEAMLAAMTTTISKAIEQEQNDMLNDRLCDLHDLADAIHGEYVEAAHKKFQSDTPPNAKPVPMG